MGKIIKIHTEQPIDGLFFAIVSAEKNYKVCWLLNRALGINLAKTTDHVIFDKKGHASHFSLFEYHNKADLLQYYVFKNKSEDKLLLPEFKQADFILLIQGELWQLDENVIKEKLKEINQVQWFTSVNLAQTKSSQNFIIDA